MLTSSSTTLTFDASTEPCVVKPRPFWPGRAGLRGTAGGGFGQQVFAQRLQAGGVHEVRDLQLAHLHRRGLAGQAHADDAVAADA